MPFATTTGIVAATGFVICALGRPRERHRHGRLELDAMLRSRPHSGLVLQRLHGHVAPRSAMFTPDNVGRFFDYRQRTFAPTNRTVLRKLFTRSRPAPIDETTWRRICARMPFLGHLDNDERARLKAQCEAFLAEKQFSGAAGFEIDDDVRVGIAIQACLPALHLRLSPYRDFVEIIVYPDRFVAPRRQIDDAGVVHESDDELAGEAMHRGPVVLSWPDADPRGQHAGYNVVIHEFAHKLDLIDGAADGTPPLPPGMRERWTRTMGEAWDHFNARLEALEASIPHHIDPESAAADTWYGQLALDPYAATDPGEFFAVATETFFTAPRRLRGAHPALYELFREYFGQDPLFASRKTP